ncbi:MAG: hypothetical protein ACI9U2_001643 [Bradymonadia bacterium]|jgi:uncharacterized protein YkwD
MPVLDALGVRTGTIVALAGLLAACGGRRATPAPTMPTAAVQTGQITAQKPALRYGDAPRGMRLNHPVQVRLLKAARAGARGRKFQASAALTRAAEQLAQATGGETADAQTIAFAASSAGLVAPVGQMLAFRAEGSTNGLADRLAPHVAKAAKGGTSNRIGVGIAKTTKGVAVVVLLQSMYIDLKPLPRQLASGGVLQVKGRLLGKYRKPQVFMTDAMGDVTLLQTGKDTQRTVEQTVRCVQKGEHRVEVMGIGPFGPTVLANLPFWCGTAPPVSHAMRSGAPDTVSGQDGARQLLALVNTTRKAKGLAALRWNARLARVAQEHSQDMRTRGFVGHVSPQTGGPGDRVRRQKIPVGVLMENVGVGSTITGIHEGLLASPGHRAAILNTKTTQLGIGVVRRARGRSADYFATQLFASPPPPVDAVGARTRTRKAVMSRVPGRRVDRGLEAVAQSVAVDLARGALKGAQANRVTSRRIRDKKIKIGALLAVMGSGPNPEKIGKDKQVGRRDLLRVGIGVARGMRDGAPTLFSVVLLAK